jgi:hypothetical protein
VFSCSVAVAGIGLLLSRTLYAYSVRLNVRRKHVKAQSDG